MVRRPTTSLKQAAAFLTPESQTTRFLTMDTPLDTTRVETRESATLATQTMLFAPTIPLIFGQQDLAGC